jgi:hypothetical protein
MWEEVESAEGARDKGRCHSQRPTAIPPHSEARGPAASRAMMTEEEAVRPAGARAVSEVLGAAALPQDQPPDREGVCGGVFGPRR